MGSATAAELQPPESEFLPQSGGGGRRMAGLQGPSLSFEFPCFCVRFYGLLAAYSCNPCKIQPHFSFLEAVLENAFLKEQNLFLISFYGLTVFSGLIVVMNTRREQ